MRREDVITLFDYSYWANRQILDAAAQLPEKALDGPARFTWRTLRDTLLFTLDVERSWRGRLRGEPRQTWDVPLRAEDYPTLRDLAQRWRGDELEMRAWLEGLDDVALSSVVDLGPKDRFPLWYFLLHMITHSIHQRRDAALLLKQAGRDPPELDFLYYVDQIQG
jgi:uncharacterized damage-inducible protein DinB